MMDLFDDFVLAYDEMERMNAALAYAKEHPEADAEEAEDELDAEVETTAEDTEKTRNTISARIICSRRELKFLTAPAARRTLQGLLLQ